MMRNVCPTAVLLAAACLLMTSCQQSNIGSRTYPDAVVSLNQVDPAYRPYFAAQNGSNYSLADQRAAFIKAAQTARGPMPSYEARSSGTRVHRKPATPAKSTARKGSTKKGAAGRPSARKAPTTQRSATKTAAKKPVAKKPAAKAPVKKKKR